MSNGTCVACPPGTYKSTSDAQGISSCTPCAAGTYSSDMGRTSACTTCPAGKYSDMLGATTCNNCPANTYASTKGSIACLKCGDSQFSYPGATNCILIATSCNTNGYTYVTYNGTVIKAYCIKDRTTFNNVISGIKSNSTYPSDNTSNAYVLMNDINLGTITNWEPIATSSNFDGYFFGNNKTISGTLTCTGSCGLFGSLSHAVVDGLNLNITMTMPSGSGGILATSASYSTITNVHVNGSITASGSSSSAGGLLNSASYETKIDGCSFTGTVSSVNAGAAGIVNNMSYSAIVTNSFVNGNISGKNSVGGIMGNGAYSPRVRLCNFTGTISGTDNVGGIIGSLTSTSSDAASYNYVTNATINGHNNVGGIIGQTANSAGVLASYFSGIIEGNLYVGGIIGQDTTNTVTIDQCGVFGTISGKGSSSAYIAGLAGSIGNGSNNTNIAYIKTSFTAADIKNTAMGTQLASFYGSDSTLIINDVYSIGAFMNIQYAPYADVYVQASTATSAQICAIWASGTENLYTGSVLLSSANALMYYRTNGSSILLLNELNDYSSYAYSEARWEARTCTISTGPANGTSTKIVMPIPKSLPYISFCQ